MNAHQYKRFLLILLLPLLACGAWLAETETLIVQNHQTLCDEREDHFSCVSIPMTEKRKAEFRSENGGVFLWSGANLQQGFHADILTNGVREMEHKDGALREKQIVGAGLRKTLNIDKHAGARYTGGGPCTLTKGATEKNDWHVHCGSKGLIESFKFVDEKSNAKYLDLMEITKREDQKRSDTSRNAYVFSILFPFIVFLSASGLIYLLLKTVSFVRDGKKDKVLDGAS